MKKSRIFLIPILFSVFISLGAAPSCKVKPIGQKNTTVTSKDNTDDPPQKINAVTALALGQNHSCALIKGEVWCWGYNNHGQLGNDSWAYSSQPVRVYGLDRDVVQIAAGGDTTCALRTGGRVECWGKVNFQDGTEMYFQRPNFIRDLYHSVRSIAVGTDHICVLNQELQIRCVGSNVQNQLDIPTLKVNENLNLNTTEKVAPLIVKLIAAGEGHSCAVILGQPENPAEVKCWGKGNGTTVQSPDYSSFGDIQEITTGSGHACMIVSHQVYCWGNIELGQLGILPRNNEDSNYNSDMPTRIASLIGNVDQITAGDNFTCARHKGNVECWGSNSKGQLGRIGPKFDPKPSIIKGMNSSIQLVKAGGTHACASDGDDIWCWGRYKNDQLRKRDSARSRRPTLVEFVEN